MQKLDPKFARHPVGRLCGVTENDSRIEAAEKALAAARLAGFSARDIRRMERMIEDAKARGVQ